MRRQLALLAAIVAAVSLTAAGCGDDEEAVEVRQVSTLDGELLPATLGGLVVEEEAAVEEITERTNAYVAEVGLFSLRDDDLLQATLQVSRFHEDADYRASSFRRAIVDKVGSSAPRAFRMGDSTVWLTTGQSQRVAVWFEDDLFFLLAVRDDFERFRGLLRETLELET